MNSKERVIRTLKFDQPDRIPIVLWQLPATGMKYGKALDELLAKYPQDIAGTDYRDPLLGENYLEIGSYTDGWGIGWKNLQRGIMGEAKHHPLADWSALGSYRPPTDKMINEGWENIEKSMKENEDKFIVAYAGDPFQRMQFLRGTENLFMDVMYGEKEVYALRDMVFEHYAAQAKKCASYASVDAIAFADDWGSQNSLLIPPRIWREFFKPCYKELINICKSAGKFVTMHSDGNIKEIYEDFIELGVDAINSQIWIMGIEQIAQRFAGRITFLGEIDRQHILPKGTPQDVKDAAAKMKELLCVNGGGLIGQCEAGPDVPLENVEAFFNSWN